MKAQKVPSWQGERLTRIIDTFERGSLKAFAGAINRDGRVRGGSRRLLIDYRKGRKRIPDSVIERIRRLYPSILAGYLRGETPYMTAEDQQDAETRTQQLMVEAGATAAGTAALGDVFRLSGYDAGVRESLEAIEHLTPGGHVARSALHQVWHLVSELEGVPRGKSRIKRLTRLVEEVDQLLPLSARPTGTALETFRLGVLTAMLAALGSVPAKTTSAAPAGTAATSKKTRKRR